jgi:hypothetical protein
LGTTCTCITLGTHFQRLRNPSYFISLSVCFSLSKFLIRENFEQIYKIYLFVTLSKSEQGLRKRFAKHSQATKDFMPKKTAKGKRRVKIVSLYPQHAFSPLAHPPA